MNDKKTNPLIQRIMSATTGLPSFTPGHATIYCNTVTGEVLIVVVRGERPFVAPTWVARIQAIPGVKSVKVETQPIPRRPLVPEGGLTSPFWVEVERYARFAGPGRPRHATKVRIIQSNRDDQPRFRLERVSFPRSKSRLPSTQPKMTSVERFNAVYREEQHPRAMPGGEWGNNGVFYPGGRYFPKNVRGTGKGLDGPIPNSDIFAGLAGRADKLKHTIGYSHDHTGVRYYLTRHGHTHEQSDIASDLDQIREWLEQTEEEIGSENTTVNRTGRPQPSILQQERVASSLRYIFGDDDEVTPEDLVDLSGASGDLPISKIEIYPSDVHRNGVTTYVSLADNKGEFEVSAYRESNEMRPMLHLDAMYLSKDTRGKGLGTKIVSQQIDVGRKFKLAGIDLQAERIDSVGAIGYKVWPYFGFDGPIPPQIQRKLPSSLADARDVSDLLKSQEGREFWEIHGDSVPLQFDLDTRSQSLRAWRWHLERQLIKLHQDSIRHSPKENDTIRYRSGKRSPRSLMGRLVERFNAYREEEHPRAKPGGEWGHNPSKGTYRFFEGGKWMDKGYVATGRGAKDGPPRPGTKPQGSSPKQASPEPSTSKTSQTAPSPKLEGWESYATKPLMRLLSLAQQGRNVRVMEHRSFKRPIQEVESGREPWYYTHAGGVAGAYAYEAYTTIIMAAKVNGKIYVGVTKTSAWKPNPAKAWPVLDGIDWIDNSPKNQEKAKSKLEAWIKQPTVTLFEPNKDPDPYKDRYAKPYTEEEHPRAKQGGQFGDNGLFYPGGEYFPKGVNPVGGDVAEVAKEIKEEGSIDDKKEQPLLSPVSKANIRYATGTRKAYVAQAKKVLFGDKDVDDQDIVSLCGIPDTLGDAIITCYPNSNRILVRLAQPSAYDIRRSLYKNKNGELILENEVMWAPKDEGQRKGFGLQIFDQQVQWSQKLGVKKMITEAVRKDDPMDPGIGYKIWPKFGYNAPIPDDFFDEHRMTLMRHFNKAETIQDLYQTPEGQEFWSEWGDTVDMEFDLTPGSDSLRIWNAYLEARKKSGRVPSERYNSKLSLLVSRFVDRYASYDESKHPRAQEGGEWGNNQIFYPGGEYFPKGVQGTGRGAEDIPEEVKSEPNSDLNHCKASVGFENPQSKYTYRTRCSQIFGRHLTPRTLATICGMPDNFGDVSISVSPMDMDPSIVVKMEKGDPWDNKEDSIDIARVIRLSHGDKGNPVIYNSHFFTNHKGFGLGYQVLSQEIEWARKAKIAKMETLAARTDDGEDSMIGYKVWPKFGYDGLIPMEDFVYNMNDIFFNKLNKDQELVKNAKSADAFYSLATRDFDDKTKNALAKLGNPLNSHELLQRLGNPTKVSDLYKTEIGQLIWDLFGVSTDMTFNLSSNSYSMRVWKAYQASRKASGRVPKERYACRSEVVNERSRVETTSGSLKKTSIYSTSFGRNSDMTTRRPSSVLGIMVERFRQNQDLDRYTRSSDEVDSAASAAHLSPSEAQKKAGNYRKGHIHLHGMNVTIENPRGSIRSGVDGSGKPWSVEMTHHYGYIKQTESEADGDHIDVFIGPVPSSEYVVVINQVKPNGQFDEHKCMLGFKDKKSAIKGYHSNYSKGWKGFGSCVSMTMSQFRRWCKSGNTKSPVKSTKKALDRYAYDESKHERADVGGEWGNNGVFYVGGEYFPKGVHGVGSNAPENARGALSENATPKEPKKGGDPKSGKRRVTKMEHPDDKVTLSSVLDVMRSLPNITPEQAETFGDILKIRASAVGESVDDYLSRRVQSITSGSEAFEEAFPDPTQSELDRVFEAFEATEMISPAVAMSIIGSKKPQYLKKVEEFMDRQKEKFNSGKMTSRDVAKALAVTVASQSTRGGVFDIFMHKVKTCIKLASGTPEERQEALREIDNISDKGKRQGYYKYALALGGGHDSIPEIGDRVVISDAEKRNFSNYSEGLHGLKQFVDWAESPSGKAYFKPKMGLEVDKETGHAMVRPEEAAAGWLFSPSGQEALNGIENGSTSYKPWRSLQAIRGAMGDDRFRTIGFFGEKGIDNIPNVAKKINEHPGNIEKAEEAFRTLSGIADGKIGFIKALFGIPETSTVDAVQLNFWLTGKGSIKNQEDPTSLLIRDINKHISKDKINQPLIRRIQDRMESLRRMIDPTGKNLTAHILHHWLWDKAKDSVTTHGGMNSAMELAQTGKAPQKGQPRIQKGAIKFTQEGKAMIHAFNSADVSTFAHEFAHLFRRDLVGEDLDMAKAYCGVGGDTWDRDSEEKWALAVEKFLYQGTSPTKELRPVFSRFSSWMRKIYGAITRGPLGLHVTKPVNDVIKRLFTPKEFATKSKLGKIVNRYRKATKKTDRNINAIGPSRGPLPVVRSGPKLRDHPIKR